MKAKLRYGLILAGALAMFAGDIAAATADGVLTIGRREDGTTMDPIKTAQNVDFWVFSNMYDVLVRVDKTGTKLEPGLAESWTVSDDQLTYTFALRDAKFSDGSPITAEDAAWNLLRIRDYSVRGFATGVAAHGIGTARAFQVNQEAGAFAALGMGLNGVLTAILVPVMAAWMPH